MLFVSDAIQTSSVFNEIGLGQSFWKSNKLNFANTLVSIMMTMMILCKVSKKNAGSIQYLFIKLNRRKAPSSVKQIGLPLWSYWNARLNQPMSWLVLKEITANKIKTMTDMTMNSNLMFRSMFFMNDEATRHFLAPPLPPIQPCDIQTEYFQKKLGSQGTNTPGPSSATTSIAT